LNIDTAIAARRGQRFSLLIDHREPRHQRGGSVRVSPRARATNHRSDPACICAGTSGERDRLRRPSPTRDAGTFVAPAEAESMVRPMPPLRTRQTPSRRLVRRSPRRTGGCRGARSTGLLRANKTRRRPSFDCRVGKHLRSVTRSHRTPTVDVTVRCRLDPAARSFPRNAFGCLVLTQTDELRVPQVIVGGPLQELELSHEDGL
jgi:hypothetical protein